jgi:hypothetical protein
LFINLTKLTKGNNYYGWLLSFVTAFCFLGMIKTNKNDLKATQKWQSDEQMWQQYGNFNNFALLPKNLDIVSLVP